MQTCSSGSPSLSENVALPTSSKRANAHWKVEEEDALLIFLQEKKDDMANNDMFKPTIY
jgi:hypothetical protein